MHDKGNDIKGLKAEPCFVCRDTNEGAAVYLWRAWGPDGPEVELCGKCLERVPERFSQASAPAAGLTQDELRAVLLQAAEPPPRRAVEEGAVMMPHHAFMWLARLVIRARWAFEVLRLCWCLTVALMLLYGFGPGENRDRLIVIALASVLMGLHRPLPRGEP
jgi:hypothetical protein